MPQQNVWFYLFGKLNNHLMIFKVVSLKFSKLCLISYTIENMANSFYILPLASFY